MVDRISLADAKQAFRSVLGEYVADHDTDEQGYDEASAESFPASDSPSFSGSNGSEPPHGHDTGRSTGRASKPTPVTLEDGSSFEIDHGAVTIAAITSCTNTSNPSVMVGAALLAKNAVDRGLTRKPWVKTTLAPGSKVVMDYYERAGLTPYLEKLGFNLVGYGCTTCIGNSGPLIPEVSQAVNDADLAVTSVLSGNRNFEGRINPDVKMNYRVTAAGGRLRARRVHGRRPIQRPVGTGRRRATTCSGGTSGRRLRRSRRSSAARSLRDVHHRLRRRVCRRRALAVAADPGVGHLRLGH